jgi:hypothetical protein
MKETRSIVGEGLKLSLHARIVCLKDYLLGYGRKMMIPVSSTRPKAYL